MADALSRWRERCVVPRNGRTAVQEGIALARGMAFQKRHTASLIPELERLAQKAANPGHRQGLYLAIAWLKEEVARG